MKEMTGISVRAGGTDEGENGRELLRVLHEILVGFPQTLFLNCGGEKVRATKGFLLPWLFLQSSSPHLPVSGLPAPFYTGEAVIS